MLTPEQLLASQKSQFEILLGLTRKAIDSAEKLAELNLATLRSAIDEAAGTLSISDPQQLLTLPANALQAAPEKAAAYARQVYDIGTAANAEVGKVVEAATADLQKAFMTWFDSAIKNVPAGSENAVQMVKSVVSAANDAYDNAQKAAKQVAEVAEANFSSLTATSVAAKPAATGSRSKRAA